jgi:hypothetical protein
VGDLQISARTRSEHDSAQSENESLETDREEGVAEIGDAKGARVGQR